MGGGGDSTYYDMPVVKEPVWIWAVPAYFYTGGAAGAAALLGAIAQASGDGELEGLVRRCRLIAAAGTSVGTALLIHDLGRPERFLNMLRVFRPTSPMSLGSWVLAAASGTTAAAAAGSLAGGKAKAAGDLAGYASGALGPPLAGYSAVLVANTAVPVWQGSRRTLPPLFMASAAAAAGSLLEVMGPHSGKQAKVVERFAKPAKLAELGLMAAVMYESSRTERVGRVWGQGVAGALWKSSAALVAASLVAGALPGKGPAKKVVSGALGTLGGIALRFAVFHAGKASARDPRATFHQQRAGLQPQ